MIATNRLAATWRNMPKRTVTWNRRWYGQKVTHHVDTKIVTALEPPASLICLITTRSRTNRRNRSLTGSLMTSFTRTNRQNIPSVKRKDPKETPYPPIAWKASLNRHKVKQAGLETNSPSKSPSYHRIPQKTKVKKKNPVHRSSKYQVGTTHITTK